MLKAKLWNSLYSVDSERVYESIPLSKINLALLDDDDDDGFLIPSTSIEIENAGMFN